MPGAGQAKVRSLGEMSLLQGLVHTSTDTTTIVYTHKRHLPLGGAQNTWAIIKAAATQQSDANYE